MKNLLLIVSVLLFFSCGSVKKTGLIQISTETHKELDSLTIVNYFSDFSIDIPKHWYGYVESHNKLAISPRVFLKGMKESRFHAMNHIYLTIYELPFSNKKQEFKTIEDALTYIVSNLKDRNKKFTPELTESQHPLYGKMYHIKYGIKLSYINKIRTHVVTIIKHKEKEYSLSFSSLNEYFDTYINDLAKMITSFKIKEDVTHLLEKN